MEEAKGEQLEFEQIPEMQTFSAYRDRMNKMPIPRRQMFNYPYGSLGQTFSNSVSKEVENENATKNEVNQDYVDMNSIGTTLTLPVPLYKKKEQVRDRIIVVPKFVGIKRTHGVQTDPEAQQVKNRGTKIGTMVLLVLSSFFKMSEVVVDTIIICFGTGIIIRGASGAFMILTIFFLMVHFGQVNRKQSDGVLSSKWIELELITITFGVATTFGTSTFEWLFSSFVNQTIEIYYLAYFTSFLKMADAFVICLVLIRSEN